MKKKGYNRFHPECLICTCSSLELLLCDFSCLELRGLLRGPLGAGQAEHDGGPAMRLPAQRAGLPTAGHAEPVLHAKRVEQMAALQGNDPIAVVRNMAQRRDAHRAFAQGIHLLTRKGIQPSRLWRETVKIFFKKITGKKIQYQISIKGEKKKKKKKKKKIFLFEEKKILWEKKK